MNEQATSAISDEALDLSRTVITAMIKTIDEQISHATNELAAISQEDFVLGMATVDVNGDADAVTTPLLGPDAFVITLLIRSLGKTKAYYVERLEVVDGISAKKFETGLKSMFDDLFANLDARIAEDVETPSVDLDAEPDCTICRAEIDRRLAQAQG